MSKMTFWEKLSYILGKDPLKGEKNRSPLAEAVFHNDFDRLDFFAKHSKLSPSRLASTAMSSINNPQMLKKLEEMGAKFEGADRLWIVKHIINNFFQNPRYLPDSKLLNFFKENKVSLNFINVKGVSLYDRMPDKSLWFVAASSEEIGHEFRQAVVNRKIDKVGEMLSSELKKVDINAPNSKGKTALMYAVDTNNIAMASLLYEHGADATKKDKYGNNIFAGKPGPDMVRAMMEMFAKSGDTEALRVAAESGMNFTNPNLASLAKDENTLKFLAKKGAPFYLAIQNAENADIRENTMGGEAAKRLAMLRRICFRQKQGETSASTQTTTSALAGSILKDKVSGK